MYECVVNVLSFCSMCSVRTVYASGLTARERVRCVGQRWSKLCVTGKMGQRPHTFRSTERRPSWMTKVFWSTWIRWNMFTRHKTLLFVMSYDETWQCTVGKRDNMLHCWMYNSTITLCLITELKKKCVLSSYTCFSTSKTCIYNIIIIMHNNQLICNTFLGGFIQA